MSSSQASSIGALDFRRLFEAAPALYLVIAPDLTIIAVSDAYVAALRTTREKILGRGILEAFPDSSQHPFGTSGHSLTASLQNVLESRTPEVMPVQRTRIPALDVPDNHEDRFWTPINTPVVDSSGTVSCIIHRIEDATPVALLKRTQREHEQFGEDQRARLMRLEAEMFNRSEELLEAYRQLQKANATQAALLERIEAQERELQAFSYSVSHDLRAPLRHIAGFIDLLTKHCRNSMDTEGQHYLKAITSSVKGLDILIEDLLNFSLVSHSDLKTTSVDLTNLAQDVVAHLEPLHGGPLTHWDDWRPSVSSRGRFHVARRIREPHIQCVEVRLEGIQKTRGDWLSNKSRRGTHCFLRPRQRSRIRYGPRRQVVSEYSSGSIPIRISKEPALVLRPSGGLSRSMVEEHGLSVLLTTARRFTAACPPNSQVELERASMKRNKQ
jgi:signal transduction histidine kinase